MVTVEAIQLQFHVQREGSRGKEKKKKGASKERERLLPMNIVEETPT
jgi:hypothetical protein